MHGLIRRVLVILALLCPWAGGVAAAQEAASDKDARLAGVWVGTLDDGKVKLRLVIELKRNDAGAWTGTMDSPDQRALGIPIDAAKIQDGAVSLDLASVGGSFTGRLADDGKQIAGTWKQGPAALPLVLKPGERNAPPRRPQEPKAPFPYDVEEVSYDAGAGIRIAGTLTKPPGGKPVAAALLITGSGPENRDEELFGHKPFLVLADHLTRRGIAVLRVDDRGVGRSTGDASKATSADFAQDVLAGVAYLKTRRDVDPARIGLIGHSEGGLIAPAAAAQSPDVAFIVLMAGPGVTGEEILYRQGDLIAAAAGAQAPARAAGREVQRKMFEVAKSEPDDKLAAEKIRAALRGSADTRPLPPAAEAQIRSVLTPWFRYFLTYDPRPALLRVRCPVLALNGERDLQVDPKQNLPAIEAALKEGRNADVTVRELPGLNHLFQECRSGALSEYTQIEETINPAALKLMGDWIAERFVAK